MMMANIKTTIDVTGFDEVKQLFGLLKEFSDDNRVPLRVRNEFMDKANKIMESSDVN
jgi:selenophosphate synthase